MEHQACSLDALNHGLADAIKDKLVSLERPADLDYFITLAIKDDNRRREQEKERVRQHMPLSPGGGFLMVTGLLPQIPPVVYYLLQFKFKFKKTRLTSGEAGELVSRTVSPNNKSCSLTDIELVSAMLSNKLKVLIDSGADEVLWTRNLLKALNVLCSCACASDGKLLYRVTHRTEPLKIIAAKEHTEQLSFYLYSSPLHPLILGFP